jgi:hypothetical protein
MIWPYRTIDIQRENIDIVKEAKGFWTVDIPLISAGEATAD